MRTQVVEHPLASVLLTTLRDERTDNAAFRAALHSLSRILIYEAMREVEVAAFDIVTPVAAAGGVRIVDPPLFVPVLRAGLGMLDAATEWSPRSRIGFVGIARDEATASARPYMQSLPEDISGRAVFVLDPMLATGGSMLHTLELLAERGATDITAICVVAAREGIAALEKSRIPVRLFTAAVDPGLDDRFFIVPGLGDAGDRQFGPR